MDQIQELWMGWAQSSKPHCIWSLGDRCCRNCVSLLGHKRERDCESVNEWIRESESASVRGWGCLMMWRTRHQKTIKIYICVICGETCCASSFAICETLRNIQNISVSSSTTSWNDTGVRINLVVFFQSIIVIELPNKDIKNTILLMNNKNIKQRFE